MDTEDQPATITGSLVQRPSQRKFEATENERKLAALIQLGSHYWTPDFTPAQARQMLADYIEDLARMSVGELETSCRSWRQDPKNKRFPRAAELIQKARDFRVPDAPRGKPEFGGRPIMWWALPKCVWNAPWRESEVPMGEMMRDRPRDPLRLPDRL